MRHHCKRVRVVLIRRQSQLKKMQVLLKKQIKRCKHIFLDWMKSDSFRKKKTTHQVQTQHHQQVVAVVAIRDHLSEICLRKSLLNHLLQIWQRRLRILLKKRTGRDLELILHRVSTKDYKKSMML